MGKLSCQIGDLSLKNPLIMASGTYGFGEIYSKFYDPSLVGGISSKGLTYPPKEGNEGIRIWETPSGIMNSIGLENPGLKTFIQEIYPQMRKLDTALILNLGGNCMEDYLEGVALLNDLDIDILELNISCPNVKEGGLAFGLKAESARAITQEVVQISRHPVMVKLSPNGDSVADLAQACQEAGAAALSLVNTFQAMAIDVDKRQAVFDNIYAGLSGPAIYPIALRMVHQVVQAVDIPVVGIGGVSSARDVLGMIMAGAQAVQIGTGNLVRPGLVPEILRDLEAYMDREGLTSLDEIRGIL
ncbi:MAG: dihydroorotate dehydrogenase [Tissierellia bacterium]|nr:dihydroorotate dehydrogenase [Tissierellia bacterium]